jgi:hypothetical protein
MIRVSAYHVGSDEDVRTLRERSGLYVETNLRCCACRRPLVMLARYDPDMDHDMVVTAMLREYRMMEATSCISIPFYNPSITAVA